MEKKFESFIKSKEVYMKNIPIYPNIEDSRYTILQDSLPSLLKHINKYINRNFEYNDSGSYITFNSQLGNVEDTLNMLKTYLYNVYNIDSEVRNIGWKSNYKVLKVKRDDFFDPK